VTSPSAAIPAAGIPADVEPAPAADAVPRFRAWAWRDGRVETLPDVDAVGAAAADAGVFLWIDVAHDDPALLAELSAHLGLHELVVEDIVEQNQRAKFELTDNVLHLVMFALSYDGGLESTEIDFVVGERFLLSAHAPTWDAQGGHHFRGGVDPFLAGGPDYVLWAIVDELVDGYFPVFDRLGDKLDDIQDEVVRKPSRGIVEDLFAIKRDLLAIRHAINPQREIFNQLTNRELTLVRPERIIYFRDVYDHLIRLTDELDSLRDMVGTTLDAYLTTINNDLSEVMKRLTAVTVILAGIAAIGGIFGMSEAPAAIAGREGIGFWVIVAISVGLGAIALAYFRRIGWL
jgi:magnesium transporter